MTATPDVAVIGGGIAGACAALAAAEAGARVVLLRAGPGVTALCTGTWSGPLPAGLARALDRAGLPHVACDRPLPHPAGDHRPCTFAPPTHAAARIEADTLVCGIAGLPGFHAAALARLWSSDGVLAPHATLVLDGTPPAGWSAVALAAALDRDPALLAGPLAHALRTTAARRVVLPAVLGLQRTDAIRAALSEDAGGEIGEALGIAPSLPGWRLARALDTALRNAGIQVHQARATRAANGKSRVDSVQMTAVAASARDAPHDVRAACFILATGKFAGGGISGSGRFRETVLDCPVWIDHLGRRFDTVDPLALTSPDRRAAQPILGAGVRTDPEQRPLDRYGDVVYENVVVAGSVRAGETAAELGLGRAAQDGWRAGQLAARRT